MSGWDNISNRKHGDRSSLGLCGKEPHEEFSDEDKKTKEH